MKPKTVLADRPKLHRLSDGSPTSWALSDSVLQYLETCLSPVMRTLETGAGYSTVVFAVSGAEHVCVTPAEREKEDILAYLAGHNLSPRLTFVLGPSDKVLPVISEKLGELDFVFIDGAHRFPVPLIDFHYTESRLKVGGTVGVDDINLPSVRVLYDFLAGEDEWELVNQVQNTAFFKRLLPPRIVSDWQGQRMNRSRAEGPSRRQGRSALSFLSRLRR